MQRRGKCQDSVDPPARIIPDLLNGDIAERNSLSAAANQILRICNMSAEVIPDYIGQLEAVLCRIQYVGSHHRVASETPQVHAASGQDDHCILHVVAVLLDAVTGKEGRQAFQDIA